MEPTNSVTRPPRGVTISAPERSLVQRMQALDRANEVRTARASTKRTMKTDTEWVTLIDLIRYNDEVRPPAGELEDFATMKVYDLLRAAHHIGTVKAKNVLGRTAISPSKTLGGLTRRQRDALLLELGAARRRRATGGAVIPLTTFPDADDGRRAA